MNYLNGRKKNIVYIKLKEINEQKRQQAFNSQQEYNVWAKKQYIRIERLAKLWVKR